MSELAAANRQRDALYLLSEQLHRVNSGEEIYSAAMDAIEAALDCDRSAILLRDADGIMQFVASHGLSDDYRAAVTGHSPWAADEIEPLPIAIPDVASADLEEQLKIRVLGEGVQAVAFIPLVSDGALIGKFMAYFREPYTFTRDDVAVSLTIARQLAFAIQRERTNALLAEELNATRMLQALSIEMAHEVDVDALYVKLIDVARNIMRADFASMQEYFPHLGARGELKLIGHHGFSDAAARFWAWVRADSSCTCGVAIVRRERVIAVDVENAAFMAGTKDQAQLLAAGIRAAQTTPLLSRSGELVGMITTHWKRCHTPSERDLRLLDILARFAADLIERKSHDEEQRRREERLRTLTQLLIDVPWQARSDGAFAELQPAWENYTGQTWDAHAGHGWFEAIHPDDRSGVQASWSAACFAAQPYTHAARLWHARSQQYRRCTMRATPIRNEDGSVREWVGACTEVQGEPKPEEFAAAQG
ncbi:MAG TPA: GAF domain-containing protein [Steroidobacteraceae bacterium]|nr:GAF domain-containing protein [Steroidobacteraceae bacterium]